MRKHFDLVPILLILAGVVAVLLAWWLLMHTWGYI